MDIIEVMSNMNTWFWLDSAGVGRTGVFITLSIVLERMRYEGVVDMFQTVKMLRTQRPAMVQTEVCTSYGGVHLCFGRRKNKENLSECNWKRKKWKFRDQSDSIYLILWITFYFWFSLCVFYFQDQYQFCYRAALEYLGSFDHYAT